MVKKCYGVECYNCHKKIVVAAYSVADPGDIVDARLPETPIRCKHCGQGSIYAQALLIHFFTPEGE